MQLCEVEEARGLGINHFVLFPKVSDSLKDNLGTAASDPDGLIPQCIKAIKKMDPQAYVWTDVSL